MLADDARGHNWTYYITACFDLLCIDGLPIPYSHLQVEVTMAQLSAVPDTGSRVLPVVPSSRPRPRFVESLTAREVTILSMIIGGATNRETAAALQISPRTVEFHRANIMQKAAAKNLAELMLMMLGGSIVL